MITWESTIKLNLQLLEIWNSNQNGVLNANN